MNKHILLSGSLVLGALSLQSCLDYPDPGSELTIDQSKSSLAVNQGNIDVIDYRKEISDSLFHDALKDLSSLIGTAKAGHFSLRGGKDGKTPVSHAYQFQYSLGVDAYAQYMVVPHKDFPYSQTTLTSSYNIAPKFNGGPRGGYTLVKNQLMPLLHHPKVEFLPELKAINLIYYCLAAQEMADISGPFSYLEDKQNSTNPTTYNDLPTIYHGIVANLDTAVAALRYFDNRPDWYKKEMQEILLNDVQTTRDLLVSKNTDVKTYIKLANSIKLRMAMRIVKVDPATAQRWAEEAVAAGVVESVDDQQGCFPALLGFSHPLVEIATGWGDARMSASLESLLMSLEHPSTKYFFSKNSAEIENPRTKKVMKADSALVGIRTGTFVVDGQAPGVNPYVRYSTVVASELQNCPLYFVKYAEVCFLRAEGALRGWNMGGSAQSFYEEGIRNAYFEDPQDVQYTPYKTAIETYLKKENATPYVQRDPMGGEDWASLTKIGVKWNDADDLETKLEKIITQKYIALFPLSTEAWAELRRTGYPKLFPVLNADDGDGSIDQGEMIRRVPWIPEDPKQIEIVNTSGLKALGGDDFQATRLWWDVNKGNF